MLFKVYMLIQEIYYLTVGILATLGLIYLVIESPGVNKIKLLLLYSSLILVFFLEQEAGWTRFVSFVLQIFVLYLTNFLQLPFTMADLRFTDTQPKVTPAAESEAPKAVDPRLKAGEEKSTIVTRRFANKRKSEQLVPLLIPLPGQAPPKYEKRESVPDLASPGKSETDITTQDPTLDDVQKESEGILRSVFVDKRDKAEHVYCQIVSAEGERPSLLMDEIVLEMIREISVAGPFIVSPYDRHKVYMLTQLLHAGLSGSTNLEHDRSIDVYLYLTSMQRIIELLQDSLLAQYQVETEGTVPDDCGCNHGSREQRKNSEKYDAQIAKYAQSEEITDILNKLDLLGIDRPSFSTKLNRHICKLSDAQFQTKLDEILKISSKLIPVRQRMTFNENKTSERIDRVRNWYLYQSAAPDRIDRKNLGAIVHKIREIGKEHLEQGIYTNCWLDATELGSMLRQSHDLEDDRGDDLKENLGEKRREIYEVLLAIVELDDRISKLTSQEDPMTAQRYSKIINLSQEKQTLNLALFNAMFDICSSTLHHTSATHNLFANLNQTCEMVAQFSPEKDFLRIKEIFCEILTGFPWAERQTEKVESEDETTLKELLVEMEGVLKKDKDWVCLTSESADYKSQPWERDSPQSPDSAPPSLPELIAKLRKLLDFIKSVFQDCATKSVLVIDQQENTAIPPIFTPVFTNDAPSLDDSIIPSNGSTTETPEPEKSESFPTISKPDLASLLTPPTDIVLDIGINARDTQLKGKYCIEPLPLSGEELNQLFKDNWDYFVGFTNVEYLPTFSPHYLSQFYTLKNQPNFSYKQTESLYVLSQALTLDQRAINMELEIGGRDRNFQGEKDPVFLTCPRPREIHNTQGELVYLSTNYEEGTLLPPSGMMPSIIVRVAREELDPVFL